MKVAIASQTHSAILVMDSRNLIRPIRTQAAPSSGWSRLYQAGPFYLDISLRLVESEARLMGHMVSQKTPAFINGIVRLKRSSGEWLEKPLENTGRFTLALEPQEVYSLEFVIDNQNVNLSKLDLS